MEPVKIGINGFGRIGRCAARIALASESVELVAINSRSENKSHAYLLQYDSIHGRFDQDISFDTDHIVVNNHTIQSFHESDPADISWDKANVDVVIEATGKFTAHSDASKHLKGGVTHVIVSAPCSDADATVVMGVNHESLDLDEHKIVSNASCTTNCLATVAKVLNDEFTILRGTMTTCHSPTQSQSVMDRSDKKDPRRGRATMTNIIPTSTGASKAVGNVLPELDGKIEAVALRVPNPHGSIIDLVVEVEKNATIESVNSAFEKAATGDMKGILQLSKEDLVSQDIITTTYSSIVDAAFTRIINNTLIKVFAWYDNEWGYATRLIDLANYISRKTS